MGKVSWEGQRTRDQSFVKSLLGTNLLDLIYSAVIVSSLLSANVSHPNKIDFTFNDSDKYGNRTVSGVQFV